MVDPNPLTPRVGTSINDFRFGTYDANNAAMLRHAGIWNKDDTYVRNQLVWSQGVYYYALQSVPANTDPYEDDGTYWFVLFPGTGYGEMDLSAPTGPDSIGAAWDPLTEFDTVLPSLGMILSSTSGEFIFNHRGLWEITLSVFFTHNEVNAGREFFMRLWNVSTGSSPNAAGVPWGTGRNQGVTNAAIQFRLPIDSTTIGDSYRIEIGAGDTYTVLLWEYLNIQFKQIAAQRPNVTGGA